MDPLLFNVFINDIFQALGRSSLYNYADDNTLSYAHHNADTVIHNVVAKLLLSATLVSGKQNEGKS